MMRFLPSFAAVRYMKQGDSPTVACQKAIEPIAEFYPHVQGAVICMNAKGEFGGATLNFSSWSFSARNATMSDAEAIPV